jgi:hypothetical protein
MCLHISTNEKGKLSMEAKTIERKYALTKLDKGDYLMPSNDGKTIWRVCLGDEPVDDVGMVFETRWQVFKWVGYRARPETVEDLEDWGNWNCWIATGCRTRSEAIQEALAI